MSRQCSTYCLDIIIFGNLVERLEMKNWKNNKKQENDEVRMKAFFECETPYKYKVQVSTFGFKPALWMLDRYFMYSLVCRSRILSWLFSSDTFEGLCLALVLLGLIGGEILILGSFICGGFWPGMCAISGTVLYFVVYGLFIAIYNWLHESDRYLENFAKKNNLNYESVICE